MTIPEVDRLWFSVGYGYQYSEFTSIDLGLTYIQLEDGMVSEPRPGVSSDLTSLPFGGAYRGEISGNISLVGVQFSHRF